MLSVELLVDNGGGDCEQDDESAGSLELQLLEQHALAYDETDGELLSMLLPVPQTDEMPLDEMPFEELDIELVQPPSLFISKWHLTFAGVINEFDELSK